MRRRGYLCYGRRNLSLSLGGLLYQLVSINWMNLSRSTWTLYEPDNLFLSTCLYIESLDPLDVDAAASLRGRRDLVTLRSLWSFWTPLTPRLLCMAGAALGGSLYSLDPLDAADLAGAAFCGLGVSINLFYQFVSINLSV